MYFYIYWDGQLVGTVIARDEGEALSRAAEKFGPIWGPVEVQARQQGRGQENGDRTAERAL